MQHTVAGYAACYLADASVGGKDDDGRQAAFQRSVEVGEALNVQHMHLINEQHARHQLCHPLIYVPIHHLQEMVCVLLQQGMCCFACASDVPHDCRIKSAAHRTCSRPAAVDNSFDFLKAAYGAVMNYVHLRGELIAAQVGAPQCIAHHHVHSVSECWCSELDYDTPSRYLASTLMQAC